MILFLLVTFLLYVKIEKKAVLESTTPAKVYEKSVKRDYKQEINNAQIQLGINYDESAKRPSTLIDDGWDESRKGLERQRNSKLNEKFKLKEIPTDFYFNTKIPFDKIL